MAVVCSNKMRELARLLLELKKTSHENLELADALNPTMFDKVVECAKRIGGYNPETKTYSAPSISAHIGTSLKQASDLLIRLIMKEDSSIKCTNKEEQLKNVKRFRELVTTQWTAEISSLAFKDMNEKRWQKPVAVDRRDK
ncbi:hypothetical protein QE152_g26656 [Popillia japonica]|uniref:Uncharacterized protein n=1 Tax=Popillia japonica TaxID=7064 RepID=A0AAW1JX98_POPJA